MCWRGRGRTGSGLGGGLGGGWGGGWGGGSREWVLEGSGLNPKRLFRGALVFLRVLEWVRRSAEKAARDPETLENLEKLDL